jgi:DNA-binding transcriptional MerR regulator
MYTPAQFAKRINVSVKTIQKWDRLGILPAKRTITNRRYYTDAELAAALRLERVPSARRTVAYCRVSNQAQKPDLENQKRILEQYCQRQGIKVDEWMTERGGGMHFKRKHDLASGGCDSCRRDRAGGAGSSGSSGSFWVFVAGPSVSDASLPARGHEYGATLPRARVSTRFNHDHALLFQSIVRLAQLSEGIGESHQG